MYYARSVSRNLGAKILKRGYAPTSVSVEKFSTKLKQSAPQVLSNKAENLDQLFHNPHPPTLPIPNDQAKPYAKKSEEELDYSPSVPIDLNAEANELNELVQELYPRILLYLNNHEKDRPLIQKSVEELQNIIPMELGEEGRSVNELGWLMQETMDYSCRTGHRLFLDKLYSGSDPIGQVSSWLLSTLNTNCHVFSAAPVFTVIERMMVKQVGKLFGYENADGLCFPGGSYSNLVSMVLARNKAFPENLTKGLSREDRPIVLTSAQGHYSIDRAAIVMGLGQDCVVKIPCNLQGQMDVDALDRTIDSLRAEGKKPFYLCAIAGTTVLGGFDHFEDIAKVCKKNNIWMNIDACWGGGVIVSNKHKYLLTGSGLADSISWNAHKMLSVPLQTSFLLLKEWGHLQNMFTSQAEYLFHGEQEFEDPGTKTPQCGRKPDAFKLWLSWQKHGRKGFEKRVDKAFRIAKHLRNLVESNTRFRLVAEPDSLNVCFWFLPPELRGENFDPTDRRLGEATETIHGMLNGEILLDHAPLRDYGFPPFFRIIISSPKLEEADAEFIVTTLERHGMSLFEESN